MCIMFFITVSYTHLALEEKKEIEFPVNERGYPQNNIVIINDTSYPIAVSYTHLDVYKRQELFRNSCNR